MAARHEEGCYEKIQFFTYFIVCKGLSNYDVGGTRGTVSHDIWPGAGFKTGDFVKEKLGGGYGRTTGEWRARGEHDDCLSQLDHPGSTKKKSTPIPRTLTVRTDSTITPPKNQRFSSTNVLFHGCSTRGRILLKQQYPHIYVLVW